MAGLFVLEPFFNNMEYMLILEKNIIPECHHSGTNLRAIELAFIPDIAHRFHQILFPALQLSSTMLTALGSRHRTGS